MASPKIHTERQHWLDELASTLEKNTLGVKIGIYSIGIVGCCYAIRSVRPFSKFQTPKDVPKSFFDCKMKLTGRVVGFRYLPGETHLLVDHRPVLFARFRSPGALPVQIGGVNISSNGVSWLQTILKDENVDFKLTEPRKEAVSCIVYYKNEDVAKQLLSIGFASVAPLGESLLHDKEFLAYYKQLLNLESKAEKRKVGMWWDGKPYSSWADYVFKKLKRALPPFSKKTGVLRSVKASGS
ncbi:Hypothetical protein NTJ_10241 [Nesidiocoris tenuis]|uniref:TNase-like domain-containing protein n=1 Tax=Nesidiocoris tenuis TaxID=355587 RepID=A0ABN7B1D6_9HEMI|nr:Hypothetical protein NTJ_10241 [Nesidiocoris tenuis]